MRVWRSLPSSTLLPGSPRSAAPRSLGVVCAKGGGSSKGKGRRQRPAQQAGGGGEAGGRGGAATKSKTLRLAEFKADEILLFDPVPAGRSVLRTSLAEPVAGLGG